MAKVVLTLSQGSALLRMANRIPFPSKIGERTFKGTILSTLNKEMRLLYKELKKHSPLLKKYDKLAFGPEEFYKPIRKLISHPLPEGEEGPELDPVYDIDYHAVNPLKTVEVELTGAQKNGLFRILYLWLHPESKQCLPPGMQEELAWPLAEQINATGRLEEEIGLTKNETVEIKYDDEVEAEKEKKEAEVESAKQ